MGLAIPNPPTDPRAAADALGQEEKYRQTAAKIREWLAAEDDSDISVLAEMTRHLHLNPLEFQR